MTTYLRIFSFSFYVIAGIGLFNYVIDPYGIFNTVKINGINYPKSEAQNYEKLVKAYLMADIKPDAVVLGTSRVGFGISPESKFWKATGRKYNLSIADGSIYVTRRFLEHAIAIHVPRQVIIGLDFFAFNAETTNSNDSSKELLAITNTGEVNHDYMRHILLSSLFCMARSSAQLKQLTNAGIPSYRS